jgi:diguanylate cyclase (GGDEF)-like protein
MMRFGVPAAIVFATLPATAVLPQSPITSLHTLTTLTNSQASQRIPASFQATVTYYRSYDKDLFVQDGHDAIYVHATTSLKLAPGDRIQVIGKTHESFRPYVASRDIKVIGHAPLPVPDHPTFEQMIRAQEDCKLVSVRAMIHSADLVPSPRSPIPAIYLRMLVDGGPVDANVDIDDPGALAGLLDSEVQITGAVSGHFDNKMQMTGVLIHVPSLDGIKIIRHPASDPWSLPITPMDRIVTGYHSVELSQRMRVRGTITYYKPGTALVLQDGPKSLWINTDSWNPLRLGDVADAIGFPAVENGFLTLNRSEVRDSSVVSPIAPSLFTWRQLALGGNDGRSHVFDLVSVEGTVVTEVRQATQDEYVLEADGHLFSAILRHSQSLAPAPPPLLKEVPLGSRIRVTGICMLADANPFNGEVPFNILIRDFDDIQVIARPPWLNVSHLLMLVGVLIALVIALGVRAWLTERKNRRRIGSLAYVEQRRARILEAINHSSPLAEILEQITELVSVRLNGAPCWCQVTDGATLGNRPTQLDSPSLRIVEHPIASRSGSTLGSVFTALDARTKPDADEKAALAMAAELATLAMETSRLYSDLIHRSEFDLLTDVQNRFAMEKTLNSMIQTARETAGIFGLIYLDLNEFKQVNDLNGHLVGDRYLQEVSRRMKHQLRHCDVLARLGGDEFAVLISEVRDRAELNEIKMRLEDCFREPFAGDGYTLHGSASFGVALYPEDADTADGLLRSADAAMYVAKYTRMADSRVREDQADGELTHHLRS